MLKLHLSSPGGHAAMEIGETEEYLDDEECDEPGAELSWVDGGVDWGSVFENPMSKNAYSDLDYVPGAT